jgi:hypothetical protein
MEIPKQSKQRMKRTRKRKKEEEEIRKCLLVLLRIRHCKQTSTALLVALVAEQEWVLGLSMLRIQMQRKRKTKRMLQKLESRCGQTYSRRLSLKKKK